MADIRSDNIVDNVEEIKAGEINNSSVKLPWLILTDPPTSSYRRFYSLSTGKFLKIDLPCYDDDPEDHRRYFSSKGWLIGVSRKNALITFFDPFSGDVIAPPTVPMSQFYYGEDWDDECYFYQFSKFVFSTRSSGSDDFEVAMIYHGHRHLAFWRPGQQQWMEPVVSDDVCLSEDGIYLVEDVCFFRGHFYSIDHYTQVLSYGDGEGQSKTTQIVVNLESQGLLSRGYPFKLYMLALDDSLLVIHRRLKHQDSGYDGGSLYGTLSFKLFKVDVDTGKATQVKDIGNRALFVGRASTFVLEASSHGGCRPNCIYFTDDYEEWFCIYNCPDHGGGIDMGIYSLDQHKVVDRVYQGPSQFSYETPPFWVEPPTFTFAASAD